MLLIRQSLLGRFAPRLVLVTVMMLGLAQAFALQAVRLLLPVMQVEVESLDRDYRVLSLDLVNDAGMSTVRLRANLAHAVYVGDVQVLPLGQGPNPPGWYQVNLSARGVMQASLILLIVVLGWPSWTTAEMTVRLCFAIPALGMLLALDAPLELLGNLQQAVLQLWDPLGVRPLFVWDRFLEGGGNAALALALAAGIIAGGSRRAPGRATP